MNVSIEPRWSDGSINWKLDVKEQQGWVLEMVSYIVGSHRTIDKTNKINQVISIRPVSKRYKTTEERFYEIVGKYTTDIKEALRTNDMVEFNYIVDKIRKQLK